MKKKKNRIKNDDQTSVRCCLPNVVAKCFEKKLGENWGVDWWWLDDSKEVIFNAYPKMDDFVSYTLRYHHLKDNAYLEEIKQDARKELKIWYDDDDIVL